MDCEKDIIKRCEYFSDPISSEGRKKVQLDLSNYAIVGVDTSDFA